MCLVLAEKDVLVLMETGVIESLLESGLEIAVEVRKYDDPGCTCASYYGIIDMSTEELRRYCAKLEEVVLKEGDKLDIEDGVWYKYFEEKHIVSPSNQSTDKEPIMTTHSTHAEETTTKEKMIEAGANHWQKHGSKYKGFFLMLLGAMAGAGVMHTIDKRKQAQESGVGSGT